MAREAVGAWGDWYLGIGDVDRPDRLYELHFVRSNLKGTTKSAVTLLEETFQKKVTKSVPLVYVERDESGD